MRAPPPVSDVDHSAAVQVDHHIGALRVNGVDALRVADASIMPTIVAGNTNAATLLIAETAAALVLQGKEEGGVLST